MDFIKIGLVTTAALLLSCAGADPTVECPHWVREACGFAQRCGQITDVEECVRAHEALADDTKLCPSTLSDPYCADLGDDFARCADEVKQAACNKPDATVCTLYTSSRSKCPILGRLEVHTQ